jgi:hypothetical protein
VARGRRVVRPNSIGQVTWPGASSHPRLWAGDLPCGGGEALSRAGDLPGNEGVGRKEASDLLGGEVGVEKGQVTWVRASRR